MSGSAYSAMPAAAIAGPMVNGSRLPVRSTRPPDQRDKPNMISGNGSSAPPAWVAAYCWSSIRFIGTTNSTIDSDPYNSSVSAFVSVKARERNSSSDNIGWRDRRSTTTNSTKNTAPTTIAAATGGALASGRGHSSSANTIRPRPSVAVTAPAQSIRRVRDGSRLSGTYTHVSASTAAASGRFRKKTARQLTWSMNQPPATGPSADVIAVNPDQIPIAPPRS